MRSKRLRTEDSKRLRTVDGGRKTEFRRRKLAKTNSKIKALNPKRMLFANELY